MKAIENLNKVQDQRDFMVSQILFFSKTSNISYDRLQTRLNDSSYKVLNNKMKKLHGENWKKTFGFE